MRSNSSDQTCLSALFPISESHRDLFPDLTLHLAELLTEHFLIIMPPPKKLINLIRGWPAPELLPAHLLSAAATQVLAEPSISTPILQYGPDAGHQPLREGLAQWLARHYRVAPDPHRICITGGASQNLANILQSFTDPVCTRAIWMVAPCYHLASGIFDDAGFRGRLRATPEDEEGIDLEVLEQKIQDLEKGRTERSEDERVSGGSMFFLSVKSCLTIVYSHLKILAHSESFTVTSSIPLRHAPTPPAKACPYAAVKASSVLLASTTVWSSVTMFTTSSSGPQIILL